MNFAQYVNDIPELDPIYQEKLLAYERARLYLNNLAENKMLTSSHFSWRMIQYGDGSSTLLSRKELLHLEYGEEDYGEWISQWVLTLTNDGWLLLNNNRLLSSITLKNLSEITNAIKTWRY